MIADSLKIEKYKSIYFDQIIQLLRLNTPHYFAAQEEADFIHYLNFEFEDYYVVIIQDEIVGCGGINYDVEKNLAIISWDMIDPTFQGKSIGKKLLEYRLAIIKRSNLYKKVLVRTSQHAFGFYEKSGFTLMFIKKDFWADGIDLYQMEIMISSIIDL